MIECKRMIDPYLAAKKVKLTLLSKARITADPFSSSIVYWHKQRYLQNTSTKSHPFQSVLKRTFTTFLTARTTSLWTRIDSKLNGISSGVWYQQNVSNKPLSKAISLHWSMTFTFIKMRLIPYLDKIFSVGKPSLLGQRKKNNKLNRNEQ